MIGLLLNGLHIKFLLFPLVLPFIGISKTLLPLFPYIVLLYIMIPLTWPLKNNKCLFTDFTANYDPVIRNSKWGNASFSGEYLAWLYKPVSSSLGWKWGKDTLRKTIYVHWIAIYLALWYTTFFVYIKKSSLSR